MNHLYQRHVHIKDEVVIGDTSLDITSYQTYSIVGIGKASFEQSITLYKYLSTNHFPLDFYPGIIITKQGHSKQTDLPFSIFESDHPQCTQRSFESGRNLITFLDELPKSTLPIFCLSGGASALIAAAHFPFTQEDKILLFQQLLRSGESIERMNRIRKEFSSVKNGALLEHIQSKDLVTLAISDVPCGDNSLIGSGPTLFNYYSSELLTEDIEATFKNVSDSALLSLKEKFITYIHSPERAKNIQDRENTQNKKKHLFHIVSDYATYAQELTQDLQKLAPTQQEQAPFNCSFKEGINLHLDWIKKNINQQRIYLSGGELPVEVKGSGQGGRNTAFVVEMAYQLFELNRLKLKEEQLFKIGIYSLATDGTDGPTEYAGGYMTYADYLHAKQLGLKIKTFIENSDSLTYLLELERSFLTGPTGTNIMDIRIITLGI